jgi:hypothetical protein
MNGGIDPLGAAHRKTFALGLALCIGTPALIAGLLLTGAIPPGNQAPEGLYQQLGYLFSGLVFLSAAWVWWRSGRVLSAFRDLPETRRPGVVLREGLIYAVLFQASSLCGLVYWILVGAHAPRHAWGFILLTPILFVALMPRMERWRLALEA